MEKEGDRSIVHVALGSHAGYFQYRRKGYSPMNLVYRSNLHPVLDRVLRALRSPLSLLQHLPLIRRWRDLAPADPESDAGQDPEDIGIRVCPKLCVLPNDIEQPPDSEWWWLRYRGKWGSTRPRLSGTVGVDSPWGDDGRDPRWKCPVAWLDKCKEDEPRNARGA